MWGFIHVCSSSPVPVEESVVSRAVGIWVNSDALFSPLIATCGRLQFLCLRPSHA